MKKNKLFQFYRPGIVSSDHAIIREFEILPTFVIVLRAESDGERMKFYYCRIEWLDFYINILLPWKNKERTCEQ